MKSFKQILRENVEKKKLVTEAESSNLKDIPETFQRLIKKSRLDTLALKYKYELDYVAIMFRPDVVISNNAIRTLVKDSSVGIFFNVSDRHPHILIQKK